LYLWHNLFLFAFALLTVALGLIAAAIINQKPFGHRVFRVTFFFPNILALPAVAMLWSMVLNPSFGLLNNTLTAVGLEELALPWLSLQYELPGARLGLYSVGLIGVWGGIGWFMLLFLAAIQNIPKEYFEAAVVDGAGRVRIFWSVTLPLIWETIRTVLVFQVIGALSGFALTYILFDRTSQKHSDLILNYYYWQAFDARNWGYAATIVVFIFLVTLVLSILSYVFLRRESVQY
jgi:N-acetylglucosamine transport system permease protein